MAKSPFDNEQLARGPEFGDPEPPPPVIAPGQPAKVKIGLLRKAKVRSRLKDRRQP